MNPLYTLSNKQREKWTPIVAEFIDKVESYSVEDGEGYPELSLTGKDINPFQLGLILEENGYQHEDTDTNGWEMDFWMNYSKEGKRPIQISGSGITFELNLCYRD